MIISSIYEKWQLVGFTRCTYNLSRWPDSVQVLTRDMLHSVTTTQECNATSLEQLHTLAGIQWLKQDDLQPGLQCKLIHSSWTCTRQIRLPYHQKEWCVWVDSSWHMSLLHEESWQWYKANKSGGSSDWCIQTRCLCQCMHYYSILGHERLQVDSQRLSHCSAWVKSKNP